MKIGENFGEISEIPKTHEKFPRKFPENFPENSRKTQSVFWCKHNVTALKSQSLLL